MQRSVNVSSEDRTESVEVPRGCRWAASTKSHTVSLILFLHIYVKKKLIKCFAGNSMGNILSNHEMMPYFCII